jgi:hypothetical protein
MEININNCFSFLRINKCSPLITIEVVEAALRYHLVAVEETFPSVLSLVIETIRSVVIKVKVDKYLINCPHVINYLDILSKLFNEYLDQVDTEFSFHPIFANPAVFEICIKLLTSLWGFLSRFDTVCGGPFVEKLWLFSLENLLLLRTAIWYRGACGHILKSVLHHSDLAIRINFTTHSIQVGRVASIVDSNTRLVKHNIS